MPGPLPERQRRRRNAPTVPTTSLPAAGYTGPIPRPPRIGRPLAEHGKAWWRWAWRTPQAAAWSTGDHVAIARRASMEDDLAALQQIHGIDVERVLELAHDGEVAKAVKELRFLCEALAGLATGALSVKAKMLDLDDRLGLTPKGMAALRWQIVAVAAEGETASDAAPDEVTRQRQARRERLSAS